MSELPPRPRPPPVHSANYYIGYPKRLCRNREELGSFTDMNSMEECMEACNAATECMSFEWGFGHGHDYETCRLSTTCHYGYSYTNWKMNREVLYVKDWANKPEHYNNIGKYYIWPSKAGGRCLYFVPILYAQQLCLRVSCHLISKPFT